jgi:hemerythrin-like domain-containing protein
MAGYVSILKKEHKHILKELDKFRTEINPIEKETALLKTIRNFIKNNSNYIKKHLTKEEVFYDYLNKQLGNKTDLKELTKTKEVIMEELSRLDHINKSLGILKSKSLIEDFIQGIKERISFEEETLFKIADHIPEKGVFE